MATEKNVETEIMDPNMPSNLDFEEPNEGIEMKERCKHTQPHPFIA